MQIFQDSIETVKEELKPVIRQGRVGKEEVVVQGGEEARRRSMKVETTLEHMLKCSTTRIKGLT